ncbi:MAG TPA: PhoU domain-containing protein [Thermoplasmata archaeon]|nr:PhoU domain-containing protein [Thermoplasmata archaeon]
MEPTERWVGRKLQVTGGSTFVVSLPKRWVSRSKLRAGETVFLSETGGGNLLLSPGEPGRRVLRSLTLRVAGPVEAREKLLRELIGAYVSGAAAVEIQFAPEVISDVRKTVRDFTRLVIGPEILEEGRTSIVVQDLSDPRELSPEKGLRRMHLIAAGMHTDALHALTTGDLTLSADVVARDEDVDRLFWMAAKQFSLTLVDPGHALRVGADPTGGLHLWLAAKSMERIADHAARIANHALLLEGRKPRKEVAEGLRRASEIALGVLGEAFEALVSANMDLAHRALTTRRGLDRVLATVMNAVQGLRGAELLHLAAVAESLSRTADYATDIAETAINHVVMRRLAAGA